MLFMLNISLCFVFNHLIKGIELLFSEDSEGKSTWIYGVLMITINWIPGVVAAIHIMSMYRHRCAKSKTIYSAGECILWNKKLLYSYIFTDSLTLFNNNHHQHHAFQNCNNLIKYNHQ